MKAKVWFPPGNVPRTAPMPMILLACATTVWADQIEEGSIRTTVTPTQFAPATPDQEAMEERRLIAAEVSKLLKEGATSGQLEEWHETNSARLAAHRQKMLAMAARQVPVLRPYHTEVEITPGASGAMEEFLMNRAQMQNDRTRIENQVLQASPRLREEALAAWELQNTAAIAAQGELAKQVSNESQLPAIQPPPSPRIPANATPELSSFLATRHALFREQAAMLNGHRNLSPEEREQALENWQAKNSAMLNELQETAAQLSTKPNSSIILPSKP